MTTPHAIIVDPMSSGRFLADEFAARGIGCVAVLSQPVPDIFQKTYFPEKFAKVILFEGDFDRLAADLRPYAPACVMMGLETGVDLADQLAARLGLPGNDPATSAWRRDKYEMQEALRAHGLRAAAQCRAGSREEAAQWLAGRDRWPVVVKPTLSAGSDNVFVCGTPDQALSAVDEALDATNILGGRNQSVVLQEYLEGREWVVDTVSCNGHHVATNVVRYLKLLSGDGHIVYRHSEFMSPENEELRELVGYALSVNDALGLRYGAAHHEIIMTPQGPVLVELNARMHGGDATTMLRLCNPVTQIDLSVDAHIAAGAFARKAGGSFKYARHLVAHFLISNLAGTVTEVATEAQLRGIRSYVKGYLPRVGAALPKTHSLNSSPGYLWLASEDEASLWSDQQQLIDMEADGRLFRVSPS